MLSGEATSEINGEWQILQNRQGPEVSADMVRQVVNDTNTDVQINYLNIGSTTGGGWS